MILEKLQAVPIPMELQRVPMTFGGCLQNSMELLYRWEDGPGFPFNLSLTLEKRCEDFLKIAQHRYKLISLLMLI